jgi:hypothetical protein
MFPSYLCIGKIIRSNLMNIRLLMMLIHKAEVKTSAVMML